MCLESLLINAMFQLMNQVRCQSVQYVATVKKCLGWISNLESQLA